MFLSAELCFFFISNFPDNLLISSKVTIVGDNVSMFRVHDKRETKKKHDTKLEKMYISFEKSEKTLVKQMLFNKRNCFQHK